MSIDKHVGARIRERRADLDTFQADLAERVHISEMQLSRYENGLTAVKPYMMEKLAKALGVDVTYFLQGYAVKK